MVVCAGASLRAFPVSAITKNSISGPEIKIFLPAAGRAAGPLSLTLPLVVR